MNENSTQHRDVAAIYARIYLFIKRYWIILIIFLILGILLGIYKYSTAEHYFRKHVVVNSIVVHKYISLDIIKSIQSLINEGNTEEIALKLNIPTEAAASLMSVDTGSYRTKENLGFYFNATIRNSVHADTITSGILYFLNSNKYVAEKVKIFLSEKQKILESIEGKMQQIDSNFIMSNAPFTAAGGENAIIVRSFATEYINLLEKKYQTEREVEFGRQMSVVDDTITKVSTGTGLLRSLIVYGLFVEILGILLALLIEAIRMARAYIRAQKA